MSFANTESVTVTTIADGSATAYTAENYNGRIINVVYTKTDFADTVDFTITTEDTAQNVWVESNVTASAAKAPRQATHDAVGAASLYAAAGEPVEDYIWMVNERLKIVIASGGDAKTGAFRLIVG
jgi:hypothetical protein